MENVSIWIQPALLLTAFVFFWREAKGSRREVKAEMLHIESRILERIDEKFKADISELKQDRSASKTGSATVS